MKKRLLSILLVLVMVLSLVPGMSITASAEEPEVKSEDFYFSTAGRYHASSEHFTLEAQVEVMWQSGWVAGRGFSIVIEAKDDTNIITAIEAGIYSGGDDYSYVRYSSGEKVETGNVADYSVVHVNNISSNRLEIYCDSGTVQLSRITVYYTHDHHNFACDGVDNGDGTHTLKCTACDLYGSPAPHTYRPVSKVSDDPLTYTAKCTDCPSRIDDFKINNPISFNYTGSTRYQDVEKGETLKGGTKLQATYTLGDAKMIVYIDGEKVAVVEAGKTWEVPQCVKCLDYDTEWFTFEETTLTMWFETICDYTAATCETPETCVYCGHTEGGALGHTWINATCTEPKTCSVCGKTEGGPLGHKWNEATCTAPKTCARCGLTEGEPIEHTYGLVDGMAKCTGCGKIFVPAIEETQISYTDRAWNGEKVAETENEREGIVFVDENTTIMANGNWYVVNSNVTNNNRIKVWGTANLILCDGFTLEATAGINVAEGNTLNIYAQSEGTGKLIAVGPSDCAGIGGDYLGKGGTVNIYGGIVSATGGKNANSDASGAGIGGGAGRSMDAVTVYGGTVMANGAKFSAGIGGGYNSGTCGNVTVYGGTVNATGGRCGAGIGGGAGGNGGTVTVNGGTVNATGGEYGAGIGGGTVSKGGTVIINGGTVNATGGFYAAGIGGADDGATVTVNGGTVNATAGEFAAGIGGGTYGNGGNVTVNGGTVTAISGGHNSRAIGAGNDGKDGGKEDGTVTVADDMLIKGGENAEKLAVISEVGGEKYVEITPYEHTHDFTGDYKDNGDGTHSRKCTGCDATDAKAAHSGGTATCTNKAKCEACGAEYGELAAHQFTVAQHDETHHWNKCANCDATDTKVAHTLTAATCTKPAYCVVCHEYVGEALGHDLVHHDGKTATCTENGWEAYDTCSRCDYTTYKEIPAKGHSYTAVVTAPTCTEQGYTTHTCACGDSYVDSYVAASGHHYVDGVCTECGEKVPAPALNIIQPSRTNIKYGETLVIRATVDNAPEGAKIMWNVEGKGAGYEISSDGMTCYVSCVDSGSVKVTATLVDENGNAIAVDGSAVSDNINVTLKSNLLYKIISWFKNLFKIDRRVMSVFDDYKYVY